ncbi:MATE family efflux transporter [Chitinophagales bacterium]|nr:MATE family efflux transporter [Chitinophagales bacterium]
MNIKPTYWRIFSIAGPIMLFMFVQNLIALTDMIFLGRVGIVEYSACGLMSTFYLFLLMIGFGISRGAQILIARRVARKNYDAVGKIVDQLFIIEMGLALLLFLFVQFASQYVLPLFVQDNAIYLAGWEYLDWRSYGIFFSLFGFVLLALYSGIGNVTVIIYVAIVMAISNIFLNYSLIFGAWGFPAMGIAGAGLASSIAEGLAAVVGIIYIARDSWRTKLNLFKFKSLPTKTLRRLTEISTPLVLQNMVGVGGWFAFIAFIENMGQNALAISVTIKGVYTFFSIPSWGLASAVNSVVSNLIGQGKYKGALLGIRKAVILSVVSTAACCLLLVFFPEWVTSIFSDVPEIITGSAKLLWLLIVILMCCSISVVVHNFLMGAGAVKEALYIETISIFIYMVYAYSVINHYDKGLSWAWASELVYWGLLLIFTWLYLRRGTWRNHEL